MGKTNFSKVEEALAEGMRKLAFTKLLEEADAAKGIAPIPKDEAEKNKQIIKQLARDFNLLHKMDKGFYDKFGLKKEDIQKLLAHPSKISPDDWNLIFTLKDAVGQYKKMILKSDSIPDDKAMEQERTKQKNSRFNVSDKWLPLS